MGEGGEHVHRTVCSTVRHVSPPERQSFLVDDYEASVASEVITGTGLAKQRDSMFTSLRAYGSCCVRGLLWYQ